MSSTKIKLATSSTDSTNYDRLSGILLNSNPTETSNTSSFVTDNDLSIHFDVSLDNDGIVTDVTG